MQATFILFYSSTLLLLISTLISIFVNGRRISENVPEKPINTILFKNRKSGLQYFSMIAGLLCTLAFYVVFFTSPVTMPLLVHEIFIITVTLAISSAFLSHHDEDTHKLNVVGVVHLALCFLASLCTMIYASKIVGGEEGLRVIVDILAHSVTLASSIVALFGDTFQAGKLTETGQAVLLVVVIFFGISIFSSMDSQFQAKVEAEKLEGRFEELGTRMEIMLEQSVTLTGNMDHLSGLSSDIKANVDSYQQFITEKISAPITTKLNNHFGDGKKKGHIYLKIDSVKDSERRILNFVDAYDRDVKHFEDRSTELKGEAEALKNKQAKTLKDSHLKMIEELKEIEKAKTTQITQLESRLTDLNEAMKVHKKIKDFLKTKSALDSLKLAELKVIVGL